jgi:ATP-dependent RNA helicase DHX36
MNIFNAGEDSQQGVHALLLKAMDPPHALTITNAVELLTAIRCLDSDEVVTPLGEALCQLPVDPCMGRVVMLSALLGALPSMLRVASAMGYR